MKSFSARTGNTTINKTGTYRKKIMPAPDEFHPQTWGYPGSWNIHNVRHNRGRPALSPGNPVTFQSSGYGINTKLVKSRSTTKRQQYSSGSL